VTTDDPVFPLYAVVFHFDCGEGTEPETTTLMRPWLYKVDPGPEAVEAEAREAWPKINWRGEVRERRLLRVEVTRKPDVPWVVGWFSHETFRAGRTDDELRDSFERFVSLHERFQDRLERHPDHPCLMGAEDRWRWKPFCDCERCRERDIAMVAH
jgi:hypothetical protein